MRKGPRLVTKVWTFVYSLTAAFFAAVFFIEDFDKREVVGVSDVSWSLFLDSLLKGTKPALLIGHQNANKKVLMTGFRKSTWFADESLLETVLIGHQNANKKVLMTGFRKSAWFADESISETVSFGHQNANKKVMMTGFRKSTWFADGSLCNYMKIRGHLFGIRH